MIPIVLGMSRMSKLAESFVRASTDRWVWFGNLPEETRRSLYDKHSGKLAFPADTIP